MRIIGGNLRGRRYYPPADKWPTRPTTDFSKEALFNILNNRIDFTETRMLDLFGGTGSHSYEAASRGCEDITYVDKHGPCIRFVKETLETFGIVDRVHIVRSDVANFINNHTSSYDYIFAGPPYPLKWLDQIPAMIMESQLLAKDGLFVLEHNAHHNFSNMTSFQEVRNYGGTYFSFFQHPSEEYSEEE